MPSDHDEVSIADMPPGMVRMLFVGVFFTFAPVGALLMMIYTPPPGWFSGLVSMTLSGLIGLGWCSTFVTRRYWFLLLVIPFSMSSHWLAFGLALPRIRIGGDSVLELGLGFSPTTRLALLAAMAIAALAIGYIYTIRVSRTWERTHARTRAELDLAARVHRAIVPPLDVRTPTYEILGRSVPSSEMGGDLIDAVTREGVTDVYLVDVSGHGVGAGIVMGMIKSALRMRLRSPARDALDNVLTDLNAIVCDLTRPEMFATLACTRLHEGGEAQFALAGHLPILHARADGSIAELHNAHLPLGVMEGERLTCGRVRLEVADTLAIFTDGFTEVLNADGAQLGLQPLIDAFRQSGAAPLATLHEQLVSLARAHGEQIDDQSLVLIRRVA